MSSAIRACVVMGTVACCLALAPAAQRRAQPRPEHEAPPPRGAISVALQLDGLAESGEPRLRVDRSLVQALRSADRIGLRLPLSAGEALALDLQRFEVIAPGARFVRAAGDQRRALPAPPIVFLRGRVAGEPLSHAFLALSQSGAGLGSITRAPGEDFHITTDRSGAAPALIVHRGAGDVPDFDEFCRVVSIDDHGGGAGPGSGEPARSAGLADDAARGPRVLNVAVDSDQRYWQLFNDDADALEYIAMVCGAVSDIYLRDMNFTLALRFARIWPAGGEPFAATNLSGFRTHWQKNEDMTGLHLVHMFSGSRSTSYGGVAYLSNACTGNAFGISAFLLGGFPDAFLQPHLGNWDVNVVAHEMGHNLGTLHTHDYDPPVDTCASGANQRGTIMSYCHTRPGGLLNIDMRMHAETQDIIVAAHAPDPETCLWHDCNGNLIDDALDIADGASLDVNGDGIPDECQDCNTNGTLDPVEIAAGTAADVNGNGVPDSCESDCNGNGIPDRWECAEGLTPDVNGNRIPDSCEPDCDGNGVADFLDIENGTHFDLDRNSRPDACDDCDGNGVSDWLDVERAFNVFIGQSPSQVGGGKIDGAVREYHARSGVHVQSPPAAGAGDVPDVAFGPDRQLYLASIADHRIVRVNLESGIVSDFVPAGSGGLANPTALAFGPDGRLYVASAGNDTILRFDAASGAFIDEFVPAGSGGLALPRDLAFGPGGHLYVLTAAAGVLRYDPTGAFAGVFSTLANLNQPRGLCFLPSGELLVSGGASNHIRRLSATGASLGRWNDAYPLISPWGVTLGPNGNVYAATLSNPVRVIEYDRATGRYLRSFIRGDGGLTAPTSIAFRPPSPNDVNRNGVPDVCENLCPGDFFPPPSGDGAVNVDDLIGVILAWGACPFVGACPADIAPPGGDGSVNVDDLIAVILNWGACE